MVSDRICADFLREKSEAVCIRLNNESELSLWSGYAYFITDGVPDNGHLEKVYCHIKNIPYEIGSSERIALREEKPSDLPLIYEMYEDEECKKYLEPLPPLGSFDEKERFEAVKNNYMLYEYGMWIVEKKDTHEVIGRVGFEFHDEAGVCLGYMIKASERNKGYAREAVSIATDYLKNVCPDLKIYAECSRNNVRSIRLLNELPCNVTFC